MGIGSENMEKLRENDLASFFLCDGLSTIIPIRCWLCVFLLGCLCWMMDGIFMRGLSWG